MSCGQTRMLCHSKKRRHFHLGIYGTDAAEMLSLKMIKGSRAALQDPSSILISQSLSKAFFGDTNPLGQVVMLDQTNVQVQVFMMTFLITPP